SLSMFGGIGSRGLPGPQVAIHSGDHLLLIAGTGYDGSGSVTYADPPGVQMDMRTTQAWTTAHHDSLWELLTTPDNTISPSNNLTFNQNGQLVITPTSGIVEDGHGVLQTIYPFAKTDTTARNVASWTSNDAGAATWKLLVSATGNATAASR